ncbi:hypothetical protein [Azospirillum largimobile]
MRKNAHPPAVRQAYSFNLEVIPCEIVTGPQSSPGGKKKMLNHYQR